MICPACQTENGASARFCGSCGGALRAASAPPLDTGVRGTGAAARPHPPQAPAAKSPTTASVLSVIIPGVGQFYNDDVTKGAVMLVLAAILGAGTVGLGWFAVAAWSAWDAYQVAEGKAGRW